MYTYVVSLYRKRNCAYHFRFISELLCQDLEKLKQEGEPKVTGVIGHSETVLPNTAAPGKDIIAREIEALQVDWSAFQDLLVQVRVVSYFDSTKSVDSVLFSGMKKYFISGVGIINGAIFFFRQMNTWKLQLASGTNLRPSLRIVLRG